jgi:hypothetical protein
MNFLFLMLIVTFPGATLKSLSYKTLCNLLLSLSFNPSHLFLSYSCYCEAFIFDSFWIFCLSFSAFISSEFWITGWWFAIFYIVFRWILFNKSFWSLLNLGLLKMCTCSYFIIDFLLSMSRGVKISLFYCNSLVKLSLTYPF